MIIEAFIASQLIGARREAIEANSRGKYTREDDLLMAKTVALAALFIIGPFIWPVGVFYNTDINKRKAIGYPVFAALLLISLAGGIWAYWFVGLGWVIYTLITLPVLIQKCEDKKRLAQPQIARPAMSDLPKKKKKVVARQEEQEEEIIYDGEADVVLEMTVCDCGCGEVAKKYTLKPR